MSDAYAAAGVNIDAANELVSRYRAIMHDKRDARTIGEIGNFGGCFALRGYRSPVLVGSTDSVGTKVLVAAALERYDRIGHDLVHHCVNDILCLNAEPLFFLDYLAVGKLKLAMAESIVGGIANACHSIGMALLGGETAEMPDMYQPSHFELAGSIVGVVEADDMLSVHDVALGDVVVGLPANGFHTNGYSLVRKVLPFDRWHDRMEHGETTVDTALLAVHPCYLRYIRAVQSAGVKIKAMAHVTGGGLLDNLPRALPESAAARLDSTRWRVPPLMAQIVQEARLSRDVAYRTFNMGVGFCFVVTPGEADKALRAACTAFERWPLANAPDETAALIGEIEPRHPCGPSVIIAG